MKLFTLVLFVAATLGLAGCEGTGGESEKTPAISQPNDPSLPSDPATPEEPEDTSDPGTIVDNPPVNPPPPAPGEFNCAKSSNNVFCTGGNLGTDIAQLNLAATFTGGNPSATISNVIVTNDRIATGNIGVLQNGTQNTSTPICSQPNGPGCFAHSSCVEVTVRITGVTQVYKFMACGNGFNRSTNKFQSL